MTEEQIIKALECCATAYDCPDCPFECDCGSMPNLKTATVDLINCQKSTIDEMTKAYRSLKSEKNAEIEQKDVVIKGLEKALENVTIEADRLLKECESKEKAYTDEYILRKELKAEIESLKEAIVSKNLTPIEYKVRKEHDEKHIHIINGLKAELEQKDIEIKLLIEKKESAYDEISRLNAVLERLQGINEILESAFAAECDLSACPRKKEIRDEAIKEFEKKMNEMLFMDDYSTEDIKAKMKAVKKEMVGDE